jgi:hypothetical protein
MSTPGQGSTFWFTIALAEAAPGRTAADAMRPSPPWG